MWKHWWPKSIITQNCFQNAYDAGCWASNTKRQRVGQMKFRKLIFSVFTNTASIWPLLHFVELLTHLLISGITRGWRLNTKRKTVCLATPNFASSLLMIEKKLDLWQKKSKENLGRTCCPFFVIILKSVRRSSANFKKENQSFLSLLLLSFL